MATPLVQIIDDEPLHADLLDRALRQAQFQTAVAYDGQQGWEAVQRLRPALILLDLMLPELSGQEVCRFVRSHAATAHIPIIMITAVGTEADRLAGFALGADDYVVKPFSPREVVARVSALLRRTQVQAGASLLRSDDPNSTQGPYFTVVRRERELLLSADELLLLRYVQEREGVLLTVDDCIESGRRQHHMLTAGAVEDAIRGLRRKLENAGVGSLELLPGGRYRLLSRPQPMPL